MTESKGIRSLGIVIYPDGSQAEVFKVELSHPMFVSLRKPRRLTLAPFGLLLGLMLLMLSGCVHLQMVGDKPICQLDYQSGIKHCEYDTWQACHADLRDKNLCYHR